MSETLVLEELQAIRAIQAEHTVMLAEIRDRVGLLEGHHASLSRRMDRLSGDVALIRRRLDLVEAPHPA